jgi:glutaredoxin|tara:strand:+ start:8255 stop:8491 length:237 start_codon:yes stop_codon:yes gene_type:complete
MTELIIYTATWCGPCKKIKSWLDDCGILDEIEFVDIDTPNITVPLVIKSVPTLVDSESQKVISGANSIIAYLGNSHEV